MVEYTRHTFAGFEPEISTYKRLVETRIALQDVGFWILPLVGESPTIMSADDKMSAFIVAVPKGFVFPKLRDNVQEIPDEEAAPLEAVLHVEKLDMPVAEAIPTKPATAPKTDEALALQKAEYIAFLRKVSGVMDDVKEAENPIVKEGDAGAILKK